MAVHHGGKVGKAGKTLASKSSSKVQKVKLAKHWLITKLSVINVRGLTIATKL